MPLSQYPKDSLTTVSTHDSLPLALWWQNHPEEAKDFSSFLKIPYEESLSHENLFAILKKSHHTSSLYHINLLQEYLGLIPELTWQNLKAERINVPGTISPSNWTYRYKISIEEMIDHPKLSLFLSELIS